MNPLKFNESTHKEDSGPRIFSIVTSLLSRSKKGYGSRERLVANGKLRRIVFIINLTRTLQRNADFGKRDRGKGQGRVKVYFTRPVFTELFT
jgi:hypothetical protein